MTSANSFIVYRDEKEISMKMEAWETRLKGRKMKARRK